MHRPLSTEDFVINNFVVYPNPALEVLNIFNHIDLEMITAVSRDVDGRIFKQVNASISINVTDVIQLYIS